MKVYCKALPIVKQFIPILEVFCKFAFIMVLLFRKCIAHKQQQFQVVMVANTMFYYTFETLSYLKNKAIKQTCLYKVFSRLTVHVLFSTEISWLVNFENYPPLVQIEIHIFSFIHIFKNSIFPTFLILLFSKFYCQQWS